MKNPLDFSFCVNPLDVNLVKIQHGLLAQMKVRNPNKYSPIVEEFKLENPEREYGKISVIIYEYDKSQAGPQYKVKLTVTKKERGNYVISAPLYIGNKEDVFRFIEGEMLAEDGRWDFFSICKANVLWFDYQVKHGEFEKMSNGLRGRAKFLGWGNIYGADGIFFSITRCLLDGSRLVVRTNASVTYAGNDDVRNAVDSYGVGLRLVDIHAINDYDIEAVFEPILGAPPRFVNVNRGKQMSPANSYILATDFGGEFWIQLFREDMEGNRIFLWGDDFINK